MTIKLQRALFHLRYATMSLIVFCGLCSVTVHGQTMSTQPQNVSVIRFHAQGRPVIEGGHVTMGIRNEMKDVDRGFSLIAEDARFRMLQTVASVYRWRCLPKAFR